MQILLNLLILSFPISFLILKTLIFKKCDQLTYLLTYLLTEQNLEMLSHLKIFRYWKLTCCLLVLHIVLFPFFLSSFWSLQLTLIFSGQFSETVDQLKDYISVMGLTPRQFAALVGAGYAIGDSGSCDGLYCQRNSFSGSANIQTSLSNVFFNDLLNNQWEETIIEDRQLYKVIIWKSHSQTLKSLSPFLLFRQLAKTFICTNQIFSLNLILSWWP